MSVLQMRLRGLSNRREMRKACSEAGSRRCVVAIDVLGAERTRPQAQARAEPCVAHVTSGALQLRRRWVCSRSTARSSRTRSITARSARAAARGATLRRARRGSTRMQMMQSVHAENVNEASSQSMTSWSDNTRQAPPAAMACWREGHRTEW